MKNKWISITNTLIFIALIIADILYITLGKPYIFKTLASSIFVILGIFNLVITFRLSKLNLWYKILLFCGLIFAFIGDILLIDYFILGAIFFGIGHVFYLAAFCTIKKPNLLDGVYVAIIIGFAFAIIFGYQNFNFNGMLSVIVSYAIIISLMLGKATANSRLKNYNRLVTNTIWLGALLFYLSDMFLLFGKFAAMGKVADILCLSSYYPAQGLLALSILFVNNISKNTIKQEQN